MPGWLAACAAEVPAGDAWLGEAERRVLAGLRVEKRRADWRLGRWAAKRALGPGVQVLAAADGAPEPWRDGVRLPVSLSLSHRAGRALAVVGVGAVGCDLELVEPRSDAFVREWLPEAEQALLAACAGTERDRLANLLWTAREAAAKVLREGLRLDVRRARVELGPGGEAGWRPLRVVWEERAPTAGWWREEPGWVMAVAGAPAPRPPRPL